MTIADPAAFIARETRLVAPPAVPEIRLHLADEAMDLWQHTEDEMQAVGLPPPFWAFAWAGGQALARHLLDHPELVAGKRVLDFASGSGVVAIAAMLAGAASAVATEIDPLALAAITANAAANGVAVAASSENYLDGRPAGFDVVLAGDVFYEARMAALVEPFLRAADRAGALVLFGDPGRSYLPKTGLTEVGRYKIPVPRAIEDSDVKNTRVLRFS
jgi:predicted nicotinamide N-methyase